MIHNPGPGPMRIRAPVIRRSIPPQVAVRMAQQLPLPVQQRIAAAPIQRRVFGVPKVAPVARVKAQRMARMRAAARVRRG